MTERVRYRVHVYSWLRHLGRFLIPNWLAIAIGRDILSWRVLTGPELAHEVEHVRQWGRHGALFPVIYLLESFRRWRAGGRWYEDNRFELAAREAARRAAGDR